MTAELSPAAEAARANQALAAAGQADMIWGHVSVRDPDGRGVWIKAASWGLDEITEERVQLVSPDGEILAGRGRVQYEYPIHTEIVAARDDVGCVVHSHAPAVVAFASLDAPLRAISHEGALFTEPDLPRFTRTGSLIRTRELGGSLAKTLGDHRACLLPRHGLVTVGPDVATAVMYAVLLERACRLHLMAASAGGPIHFSDPEEVALKREEVWSPVQLAGGYQYLLRQLQ
ncbi:MAG TPA: class II aldolase/adducin family protein [Mycobacteriales bacterium]|nr:class II aldolase/adducin family protein [Mycobacteriales bacterium]